MANLTTNAAVSDTLNKWFNKDFVSNLEYTLQHKRFTTDAIIPPGAGQVARYFIMSAPIGVGYSNAGATALTEATTSEHEITSITTSGTDMTVAEFGEFIKIGSLFEMAAIESMREKVRQRLLDGANVSLDSLTHGKAKTTTNIFYASAAAIGGIATGPANTTAMGASTLIGGRKILFDALCKGFSGVSGHPNNHFAAVITPKQELDIVSEVTTSRVYWSNLVVNVPGALGQQKVIDGYIGSVYQVATYVTNNYATTTYTATVEIGYIYADGGLGSVNMKTKAPEIVINDINSPYKNVNSIAWHAYEAAALLSGTRVLKIYSLT